jgi:hypothetical protein
MIFDRFKIKNLLTNFVSPEDRAEIYLDTDTVRFTAQDPTIVLQPVELDNKQTEYHIYSGDTRIDGGSDLLQYDTIDGELKIKITPETDIRNVDDINRGYYSIIYNFIDELINFNSDIVNISADRTEIELKISDNTNLSYVPLYNLITDTNTKKFKKDLVLNFGKNDLVPVVDVDFGNNPRVGERVDNIAFPAYGVFDGNEITIEQTLGEIFGAYFTLLLSANSPTSPQYLNAINFLSNIKIYIWYPLDGTDNLWAETEQTLGFQSTKTIISTGKLAKFNLQRKNTGTDGSFFKAHYLNNPLTIGWDIERDINNLPILYFHPDIAPQNTPPDRQQTLIDPNINLLSAVDGRPQFSVVRYFDNRLRNVDNLRTVLLRLYRPLPVELEVRQCRIHRLLRESYIERLLIYPETEIETFDVFSDPNFNLDLGLYGQSTGTDYKTWNELLDANLSTSQQIIDKYISGSFGGMKLNIDYSDFSKFIHFSSAVERVRNFRYKVELLEAFNSRINFLETVSGSAAETNISQLEFRKSNLISGFDGFEKWLYYEDDASLYTHYSSSNYTFAPWPKVSNYPPELYSVTSIQATQYFNGLIASASLFDSYNDAMLKKSIPVSMLEDPSNKDYLLFVDMIGHHFDISWAYINTLTSINSREEHPKDGIPTELLYEVAQSMGWKLANGKQSSNLFQYALGTDNMGQPLQSGSLASKPHEQINYELWRRIVNNIPYFWKTKGTARGIKALISAYGIPQTFLSIQEYGGPTIDETFQYLWENNIFLYHLNFDGVDNYISAPWDLISDGVTISSGSINGIELQFQQNTNQPTSILNMGKGDYFAVILEPIVGSATNGNINFYLSGSLGYKSGSIQNVPVFDNKISTLVLQREIPTEDINQNNTYTLHYRRSNKDMIVIRESASIDIDGSTESSYNQSWINSGSFFVGNGNLPTTNTPALWSQANFLKGRVQEIRYWATPLESRVIDEHTLSRNSYYGNNETATYYDLKFRFFPDRRIQTVQPTDGYLSQHPNQNVTTTDNGLILSASLFGFEPSDLVGVAETYYTRVADAGGNNILNNKIRIEQNELVGDLLQSGSRNETSQFETAPLDSNKVGIFLSATSNTNKDVYNHTGYFKMDDYIGNPDKRVGYDDTYTELNSLRNEVFRKYNNKNLINSVIKVLSRYDFSIFSQIKQLLPARVNYESGIIIEPHILERSKFKRHIDLKVRDVSQLANIDVEDIIEITADDFDSTNINTYSDAIELSQTPVVADYIYYETNPILIGTPYIGTKYRYDNLLLQVSGSSILFITGSNGFWNYEPLGVTVIDSSLSKRALKRNFIFDNEQSASIGIASSSFLEPARVQEFEPTQIFNLKFNGCKATSDSITTNSPDTPDGRPVVEIFDADPNVLIYTTQKAETGNLKLDTSTKLFTVDLENSYFYDTYKWSLRNEKLVSPKSINYIDEKISLNSEADTIQKTLGRDIIPYRDILYDTDLD